MNISLISRGIGKYTVYALGAVLALAVLVAAAFTARLAAGPMSVAFLGPELREDLGARLYYAYDVKFDDLELRWSDGHGNLGLAMVGVRVADYSLQDIATVPEIVAGLNPGQMIGGDMKPVAITVVKPKIRWIKTAGGAIKFDIGAKKPGDSGKILEDFLITLAAAPDPEEAAEQTLPAMRIVDADIKIGNEVENSTIHISDADILIAPHAQGVRSVFDLAVKTGGEPVNISAEGLYRTEDQQIELAVNFTDLALNGLDAMLPSSIPAALLSESLTGMVELDMDKFFSVKSANFDLNGETLSLAGEANMGAKFVSLNVHGSLTESSLVALGNGWQSGLGPEFDSWLTSDAHVANQAGKQVDLALEGSVHRFDQTLAFSGTIGQPKTPFTVSGLADNPVIDIPAEL